MLAPDHSCRPRIPTGVWAHQRGSLVLLLHPDAPRWTVVNATAWEMVRLCDGRHTVEDMASLLAGRCGMPPRAVRRDIAACLDGLRRAGFLADGAVAWPGRPAAAPGGWRLHLYLTGQCNLRCRHCAVVHAARPADRLSADNVRRLIDKAVAAGANGIAFGGGEPLLREDAPALLAYAAGRTAALLATNGTLVDDQVAAALAATGVSVQVSLDGATSATHDAIRGRHAFARAWRGIEALQRHGLGARLALNVTLMRHNVRQVAQIVELAAARGVPAVRFSPLQPLGRALASWPDLTPGRQDCAEAWRYLYGRAASDGITVSPGLLGLELEPPEHGSWCGLGKMLLVDQQGDIYPCSMLAAPRFRLGNVADTTLVQALQSDRLHRLAQMQARRKDEIFACRACAWRHFCQASCPASVWLRLGTFHAPDQYCDLRRELFCDLVFRLAGQRQPASVVRPLVTACGEGL